MFKYAANTCFKPHYANVHTFNNDNEKVTSPTTYFSPVTSHSRPRDSWWCESFQSRIVCRYVNCCEFILKSIVMSRQIFKWLQTIETHVFPLHFFPLTARFSAPKKTNTFKKLSNISLENLCIFSTFNLLQANSFVISCCHSPYSHRWNFRHFVKVFANKKTGRHQFRWWNFNKTFAQAA